MYWLALAAAAAFAKKLVARYRHGLDVARILEDPPELRTVARFRLACPADALLADLGGVLGLGTWAATATTLRTFRGADGPVDVLRLVPRGADLFTLELTRAWTGLELGPATRTLLARLHAALTDHPAVHDLAWHVRQDRALTDAFPHPLVALP
jgi:hypothetical protein